MVQINKPRGLIRYDSQARFASGPTQPRRFLRPRVVIYSVLLLALSSPKNLWKLLAYCKKYFALHPIRSTMIQRQCKSLKTSINRHLRADVNGLSLSGRLVDCPP